MSDYDIDPEAVATVLDRTLTATSGLADEAQDYGFNLQMAMQTCGDGIVAMDRRRHRRLAGAPPRPRRPARRDRPAPP